MSDLVIAPAELKKRLDAGSIKFIFDLRNPDEVDSWMIEGRTVIETLNIPQIHFVGEEEKHLSKFPHDRQILTLCAHGDSSRYSAEILRSKGFDAISLEGGMDLWSELYEVNQINNDPAVFQIFRVSRGCISHVIVSGREAVIIDTGRHIEKAWDIVEKYGASARYVFETHLQADHISGGRELALKAGVEYMINPEDAVTAAFGYTALMDGDIYRFGRCVIKAIHTPGHTPGSTSLLLDDKYLFSGDTIMKTSTGRPDIGGMVEEWSTMLYRTMFEKISTLPDDIIVLPTHAASIREQDKEGIVHLTMGEARNGDLYSKREFPEFVAHIKSTLPEHPEKYIEIRKVNLGLLDPDEKKRKELEIGKNLCGMTIKPEE